MKDFAAIDFETANNERTSVCSVGVVIVRNGEIVDSFYSLIQPEPNYYNYWCTQVHGITRCDTEDAPVFPKVWKQIEPLIEGLPLVAHNKAFDESCLKAVFRCYQMDYPDYPFFCTLTASRRRCCSLWLPVREPPPRPCRCRGLCLDSKRDFVNSENMNRHINYNELLDALFEQWEDSYEQAEKDRFCRDGLLLKANPSLNINELWENSPLRVAFLLKDNPHGGQDVRGWLIDEKNGSINQNLENDFIKNIALIFYGILKTSQGQRYGYSEVVKTKMQDVIREWNTTPFALIECKKNAGGSIVSLQEMKNAFKDYGNFISKELDILKPNVLICCDGEDSQYDFVTKEYLSCSKFEEKKYYHPAYKEKLECCIRYYENENIYVIKSYHPSYRGDASRIYERVISPFGGLINALKKKRNG